MSWRAEATSSSGRGRVDAPNAYVGVMLELGGMRADMKPSMLAYVCWFTFSTPSVLVAVGNRLARASSGVMVGG